MRKKLKWEIQPVPTLHTAEAMKRPSTLPNTSLPRKAPKVRIYQEDELSNFQNKDVISCFADLCSRNAPKSYCCRKTDHYIIYYNLVFYKESGFPSIREAIKVDQNLHVQLQLSGKPVPLPSWFVTGRNSTLKRCSMLENFPSYLSGYDEDENKIIAEMSKMQHYSAKGRPPYSSDMIRFAVMLRYTSGQAYKLMLETLPLPSISALRKLRKGNIDSMKAVKPLLETGQISKDVIMMVDEMYLQKCVRYVGGDYLGSDDEGNFFKGIVVFMIQGLQQSVSVVVKACPEISVRGEWLASEMSDSIQQLCKVSISGQL